MPPVIFDNRAVHYFKTWNKILADYRYAHRGEIIASFTWVLIGAVIFLTPVWFHLLPIHTSPTQWAEKHGISLFWIPPIAAATALLGIVPLLMHGIALKELFSNFTGGARLPNEIVSAAVADENLPDSIKNLIAGELARVGHVRGDVVHEWLEDEWHTQALNEIIHGSKPSSRIHDVVYSKRWNRNAK